MVAKGPKENVSPTDIETIEETVSVPAEKKDPVTKETEKNLSESPENLFPKKSLESIGVKPSTAKELAKEVLGIAKIELPGTKESIRSFQKKNGLNVDGKVGAETYKKMLDISERSIKLVEKAEYRFDEFGLSNSTLKEIADLIPHMMMRSKNYQRLIFLTTRFKNNPKFEKDAESRELLRKIIGTTNEDKKVLEKSEEAKSVYATMKDIGDGKISPAEGLKKIATDPTMLMVGGLLFLFGVIGGDTKYTDSFMKRIGWIFGLSVFGPAVWNKLGIGEMGEDMKKAGSSVAETVKEAAEKSKPGIKKFFKEDLSEMWKDIKNFDFSSVWEGISDKYDKLTNGFVSYNESLKDEKGNTKEGYIEDNKLVALTSVMSDEKFLNQSKSDLGNISDKSSLNGIITEKTKEILNKAGISDNDVSNFIKKHLLDNAFGKEKDAKLVKDLLFTTSIKETLVGEITKTGNYLEDRALNSEINNQIILLINSSDPKIKNLGIELAKSIKLGEIDNFNIDNFGVTDTIKVKKLISKIKKYNLFKKDLDEKIKDVNNIKVILNNTTNKETAKSVIQGEIKELEKIKLNTTKTDTTKADTTSFNSSKFNEAKNNKLIELLKLAKSKDIEKIKINGEEDKINSILNKEKLEKDKIQDRKELEKIDLNDIPDVNSIPVKFKEYFDKHEADFEKVSKLLKNYKTSGKDKTSISSLAEEKAKKITEFKAHYEAVKDKYVKKIKTIKTEIDKITDLTKYEENRLILEKQIKELEQITGEIVEGFTLDDITDFYKKATGEYVANKSKNSFEYLDKKLETTTVKVDLETIAGDIRNKIIELENEFKVEIDGTKLDINKPSTISSFMTEFNKKGKIISQFKSDAIKESKEKILEKEFKKITNLYLNKVNSSSDITELEKIKLNYKSNVTDKLGTLSNLLSIFEEKPVEKAYEEKLKTFKEEKEKKELMTKLKQFNVTQQMINNIDFIKKNKNNSSVKEITKLTFPIKGDVLLNLLIACKTDTRLPTGEIEKIIEFLKNK